MIPSDAINTFMKNIAFSASIRKDELPQPGMVTRTTAERERDIQRYAARQRHEEDILRASEQHAADAEARRHQRQVEKQVATEKKEIAQKAYQQQEEQHPVPLKSQIVISTGIEIPSDGGYPSISPLDSNEKGTSGNCSIETRNTSSTTSTSPTESTSVITKNSIHTDEMLETDERIAVLKVCVANLTSDVDDMYTKRSESWQEKAIDLTMNFYALEEEMEKRKENYDDSNNLKKYYTQIQGKVECLEKELDEILEHPSSEDDNKELFHGEEEDKESMEKQFKENCNLINDTVGKIRKQSSQRCSLTNSVASRVSEFIWQFSCGECDDFKCVVPAATKSDLKQAASAMAEKAVLVAMTTSENAVVSDNSDEYDVFARHLSAHIPKKFVHNHADASALTYCKRITKAKKLKKVSMVAELL
ncbi:hypothetical protein ACHAWC_006315 [Mediolabrus comicus]